jgi:hypothetical protein
MPKFRTALGAGVAALAIAGFTGIAAAQGPRPQVMTLRLPDGTVEQIRYAGSIAPEVYFNATPTTVAYAPISALFGASSPFAELDRISAIMDRQAAQMLQQAAALSAQSTSLTPTMVADLPAGAQGYEFISTMDGNNVCSKSMEIISRGDGAPPKVITHSSGNCAAGPGTTQGFQVPTMVQPAVPAGGPRMIMTRATSPRSYTTPRTVMATGTVPHGYAGRIEEASLN